MKREFKIPEKISDMDNLLWFTTDEIMKWHEFEYCGFKGYAAIRSTGKFEGNFDYNSGLLLIHIVTSVQVIGYKTKDEKKMYNTRMYITNIDDGIWEACSIQSDSKMDTLALTDKVYNAYKEFEKSNWGNSLSTEKELNDFLMKHGMWGEFTG